MERYSGVFFSGQAIYFVLQMLIIIPTGRHMHDHKLGTTRHGC